jgi:hypothetical protein
MGRVGSIQSQSVNEMPNLTPDNQLNQPVTFGTMSCVTLKTLSDSITCEMDRLVLAVGVKESRKCICGGTINGMGEGI